MTPPLERPPPRMGRRARGRQLDAVALAVARKDPHRLAVAACCAYAAGATAGQVRAALKASCRTYDVPAFLQALALEVTRARAARAPHPAAA